MSAGAGRAAASEHRGDLEYRTERDMLRDLLGEFREGWDIRPPVMWGEPDGAAAPYWPAGRDRR